MDKVFKKVDYPVICLLHLIYYYYVYIRNTSNLTYVKQYRPFDIENVERILNIQDSRSFILCGKLSSHIFIILNIDIENCNTNNYYLINVTYFKTM